jgi:hypothetical protein
MIVIGTPHTKNAGYLRNDDRCSGGKLAEGDVQTCPHCQAVINMQQWAKAPVQNFCMKCMKPACPECEDCMPFIARIDRFSDAVVKYQTYLKQAGLEPVEPPRSILTGP